MRTNKKILMIICSIFLGGFTNDARAINWSSSKTKTFLWGGGAAISVASGLYFYSQAKKCRTMLTDPTLGEAERASISGKLSLYYTLAGGCLAGTIFTGGMAIKNAIDWKNGKDEKDDERKKKEKEYDDLKKKEKALEAAEKELERKKRNLVPDFERLGEERRKLAELKRDFEREQWDAKQAEKDRKKKLDEQERKTRVMFVRAEKEQMDTKKYIVKELEKIKEREKEVEEKSDKIIIACEKIQEKEQDLKLFEGKIKGQWRHLKEKEESLKAARTNLELKKVAAGWKETKTNLCSQYVVQEFEPGQEYVFDCGEMEGFPKSVFSIDGKGDVRIGYEHESFVKDKKGKKREVIEKVFAAQDFDREAYAAMKSMLELTKGGNRGKLVEKLDDQQRMNAEFFVNAMTKFYNTELYMKKKTKFDDLFSPLEKCLLIVSADSGKRAREETERMKAEEKKFKGKKE
jgi:DNA repair exonuclease SbcCD ATPase subunit